MYYVCDRFGFVSDFYHSTNYFDEPVIKARHCLDVREALPFTTRESAESAYSRSHKADRWWYCVLHAGRD